MQETLLQQGVELMIFGMGTVFVFLALLVVVTTAMSSLLQRFLPAKPIEPAVTRMPAQAAAPVEDQQLMAVLSAAVHKYRSRHK